MLAVRADIRPPVVLDIVHLAGHVIVAPNHKHLPVEQKRLVTHPHLVHVLQLPPPQRTRVQHMRLRIPIRVLTPNQQYLIL